MPDNNGVQYTNPPQSRNEAIIEAIIEGTEYTDPPQSENEEILVSILNVTPYEKPPTSRMADLLIQLKEFIEEGGGGRPKVPQTGIWQFKTTPTKGYIILGHDDDTGDSAQFVRMANGYGFPVVLNTESIYQDRNIDSDADSEISQYPSGSTAQFPNGCTIQELNQYIVTHPTLGEVAQHDTAIGQTWTSEKLTGDVLDGYYATYTTGGGTKTKEELKTAIMEKYASTDIAQGASRVGEQRGLIEKSIGGLIYTIGKWGGHQPWEIDGVDLGTGADCEVGTADWSRSQNYMGDGLLSNSLDPLDRQDPWHIWRNSSGAFPENIGTMCAQALANQVCIECFYHQYLTDAQRWLDMKSALDTLKTWVDQGKIEVVTRKQYYELGEFVEHPISSLTVVPDAIAYAIGTTITAANFTCNAVLDNGTIVACESDKILDLSDIDTSTAGTYTVTLKYRGRKATASVTIAGSIPTNYLVQNASFSGESMTRGTDYGDLSEAITYEANKTYKIEFDFTANTDVSYSTHYIIFQVADYKTQWVASMTAGQLDSVQGVTSGHVVVEFTTSGSKTLSKFVRDGGEQHTIIGNWTITNGNIYEVPT